MNNDYIPFSTWLLDNIQRCHITKTELANYCQLTPTVIYRQCKGAEPKFVHVVTYCWVFTKISRRLYDPEIVYKDVLKEFGGEY